MSKADISRLRSLLTARGDFWDLRWDREELDRAWRGEVVTVPPLRAYKPNTPISALGSRNTHWDFVPSAAAAIAVPQAKVYLKAHEDEKIPKPNGTRSYRISLTVLSLDEFERPSDEIKAGLFVVKGNPLVASSSPLPCFASGSDSILLDVRDDETVDDLTLQVVVSDMGAHFGVPMDEVLELTESRQAVERSMSLWDTQTGAMRGSCMVKLKVEVERPLSVSDLFSLRKIGSGVVTQLPALPVPAIAGSPPESEANVARVESARPVMPEVQRSARDKIVESAVAEPVADSWSQWTQNLLAPARAVPVEEKIEEATVSPGGRRRRGGAPANFAVTNDVINTVIPEDP